MTEHDRSSTRHEQEGDCRIDVYLAGVTPDEVDEIVEAIADLLAEAGLGAEGGEAELRSLIGIKPHVWPDLADEQVATGIVDEYGEWVIPGGGEEEEEED